MLSAMLLLDFSVNIFQEKEKEEESVSGDDVNKLCEGVKATSVTDTQEGGTGL